MNIFYMDIRRESAFFEKSPSYFVKTDVCVSPLLGHSADKAMVNGDEAHTPPEEAELKQEGNGVTDAGEESNEQEVIVIQDTGFTVKIQAPGTEPFDLQARIAA